MSANFSLKPISPRSALTPVLRTIQSANNFQQISTATSSKLCEGLVENAAGNFNLYKSNQLLDISPKNGGCNSNPPGKIKRGNSSPTTPRKRIAIREPLTPTTNLKLLTHLATGGKENGDENTQSKTNSKARRKDKSLGILCDRFISKYPEIPASSKEIVISLDAIAKDLQVERRRMYDIVNVLESVEFMVRIAKNRYTWQGRSKLQSTLGRLKAVAESENIAKQLEHFRCIEAHKLVESNASKMVVGGGGGDEQMCVTPSHGEKNQTSRRDKSLSVMSQTFLMLFLVSEPKIVSLDLAAKMLIGDIDMIETKNIQYKTKVRRLYDIANILTSLKLVEKMNMFGHNKKPAFKYTGPEVEDCVQGQPSMCTIPDGSRKALSEIKRTIPRPKTNAVCTRSKLPKAASENNITQNKCKVGTAVARHSSFQEICEVAEREREKLYAIEQGRDSNSITNKGTLTTAPLAELKLTTNSDISTLGHCVDGSAIIAFGGQTFRIVALAPLATVNSATVQQSISLMTKVPVVIQLTSQGPSVNGDCNAVRESVVRRNVDAVTTTRTAKANTRVREPNWVLPSCAKFNNDGIRKPDLSPSSISSDSGAYSMPPPLSESETPVKGHVPGSETRRAGGQQFGFSTPLISSVNANSPAQTIPFATTCDTQVLASNRSPAVVFVPHADKSQSGNSGATKGGVSHRLSAVSRRLNM